MVSAASLRVLQRQVKALPERHGRPTVTSAHLRPNIVVDDASLQAYDEDSWAGLQGEDGRVELATLMPCARCEMVCVDPVTGRCERRCAVVGCGVFRPCRKTDSGVLLALAQHRRQRGRIHFGVLMSMERGEGQVLREGCRLRIVRVGGNNGI